MKSLLRLLCGLCVLATNLQPAQAAPADTNETGFRLTVELQDGSRIVGKNLDDPWRLHSVSLSDLKLAVAGIRSVEMAADGATARLTATNGDVLAVQFLAASVRMETGFGKTELPVKMIRRLKVSPVWNAGRMPTGLVALWSAEGNANDSVGGCTGQLVNGAGYAPGRIGQAFSLNEADDGFGIGNSTFSYSNQSVDARFVPRSMRGGGYVQISACPALDVGKGGGFTIVAWINPRRTASSMLIAEYERALGTYSGSDVGVQLGINAQPSSGTGPGCLVANIKDVGDADHIFASPADLVRAGVWQQVALAYDKTAGSAALYLNGVEVARARPGSFTPQTSFANLLIGARTTFNSPARPSDRFSGRIDEISFYDHALSPAEIQAIYGAAETTDPVIH